MTTATRRIITRRLARASALCLLTLGATLLHAREARAQWTTSGANTTTTNNVGVGTPTPGAKLDVGAGAPARGSYSDLLIGSGGNNPQLEFYGLTKSSSIAHDESMGGMVFYSNGPAWTPAMMIATAGNVGIGTTTPGVVNGFNFAPYLPLHVRTAGGLAGSIAVDSANASSGLVINDSSQPLDNRMWSISQGAGSGKLTFATHADAGGAVNRVVIDRAGNVGVGIAAPTAKLHVDGNITVTGNINAKYQDVAEWVPSVEKLQAGTVVILDTARDNHVAASLTSYDTRVAGVISAQPGLTLGEGGEGKVLVATTGRVKVRVDASQGPVNVGDLLVTSDRQGYAMKSEPVLVGKRQMHAPGTIIGKALQSLAGGTGEILVLLSLQ